MNEWEKKATNYNFDFFSFYSSIASLKPHVQSLTVFRCADKPKYNRCYIKIIFFRLWLSFRSYVMYCIYYVCILYSAFLWFAMHLCKWESLSAQLHKRKLHKSTWFLSKKYIFDAPYATVTRLSKNTICEACALNIDNCTSSTSSVVNSKNAQPYAMSRQRTKQIIHRMLCAGADKKKRNRIERWNR